MDYEAMGVRELQAEAKSRGLGTSRVRAELIQRLTDHDTQSDGAFEDDVAADTTPSGGLVAPAGSADSDLVQAPISGPESVLSVDAEPTPIRAFRKTFQAEPGGPDEETHLAYRQATVQAAIEAGRQPRGDARLAATVDGRWVYEVSVRQVT